MIRAGPSSSAPDPDDNGDSSDNGDASRGIAEGIYFDEDPDRLVRKLLALKQLELSHRVEKPMQTDRAVVLDRLENQFVRAFCAPDPQAGV